MDEPNWKRVLAVVISEPNQKGFERVFAACSYVSGNRRAKLLNKFYNSLRFRIMFHGFS